MKLLLLLLLLSFYLSLVVYIKIAFLKSANKNQANPKINFVKSYNKLKIIYIINLIILKSYKTTNIIKNLSKDIRISVL